MATSAELKALSNSQLASGTEIPATKHRTVNDAIIDELFLAQSRGNVLAAVQTALSIAAGDKVFVIRSGQAYLLDADEFGFISNLVDLDDVSITSPSNNQIVVWDSTAAKFVVKDLSAISAGGNITGAGTTNLLPKFTSAAIVGNSIISDDGTDATISGGVNWTGIAAGDGRKISNDVIALGSNPTSYDLLSKTKARFTVTYTATNTLTFSNASDIEEFTMQLTNTNANVITFAGITLYFKTDDLPSGVTFASNALTFPADSAVKYNIVGVAFDGSTFDCKIEIR